MAHERGHLGRGVALVQVDAPRVDDHGNLVDGADKRLEAVAFDGTRLRGEALDVVVVDAAHRLDQALQVPQARAQHDSDGVLDGRRAGLDDVFGDHADPLLLEQAGIHAVACRQLSGVGTIVDQPAAARGAFLLQHGERYLGCLSCGAFTRSPGDERVGHVLPSVKEHALPHDLGRRSRTRKPRGPLGAHGACVAFARERDDLGARLGAAVVTDGLTEQARADRDPHRRS